MGKALSLSLKHATAISKWRIHHCVLAACISTKIQTDSTVLRSRSVWNQQVVRWNVSMRVHRLTQQILRVVSKYNLISELSKFQLHVNYSTKGEISFVRVWVAYFACSSSTCFKYLPDILIKILCLELRIIILPISKTIAVNKLCYVVNCMYF